MLNKKQNDEQKKKTVWQVSREYAGIAEAGGVKNVACSLAEGLSAQGVDVTQFIPLYGCTPPEILEKARDISGIAAHLVCNTVAYTVQFKELFLRGVHIILADASIFREKQGVYTYTIEDERKNGEHRRGTGHKDANLINVLFQKTVLLYARLSGIVPDVLQCQDAHTALIPAYIAANPALKKLFWHTKCIVTMHNAGAGYHQQFNTLKEAYVFTELPFPLLKRGLLDEAVEPFLIAHNFAELTTVSPWYAQELMDPENNHSGGLSGAFAKKEIHITGITNGIDFNRYDPKDVHISGLSCAFDPETAQLDGKYEIRRRFIRETAPDSAVLTGIEQFGFINDEPAAVYFGYHGRIAHQKGLDILALAARFVLNESPQARFIIIGQGDADLEQLHIQNARDFAGKYLFLRGYERSVARTCVAASDFLVLPSVFEPCGLEDFIAQMYGTVPVAHAVGGLQKIIHQKTGWLYHNNTIETLAEILNELCKKRTQEPDFFVDMIRTAAQSVRENYSWQKIIKEHYLKLYFT